MDNGVVKFGLIGCGSVAPYHAAALRKAPNAELVMVADADEGTARRFAARFGVPHASGVDELLAQDGIQAVTIATPPDALAPLSMQAARAGKHVLVEKPMATGLDDARALVQACERAGVKLSVWYERRYQPFAVKARSLIREGALGQVMHVMIHSIGYKRASYWSHGFRNDGPLSDWRRSAERSGGGVLNMNAIHQIDLMRFLTGLEVREVFARTGHFEPALEVESVALVTMQCQSGALVDLVASSYAYGLGSFPIYASRDILCGTEGSLILDTPLQLEHKIEGSERFDVPFLDLASCKALAVEDFARAIVEGLPPPVSAADGLSALSIVRTAYQSADAGLPLELGKT